MWSYRIYIPERRTLLRVLKDKCEHKSLDYTTHNRKLEYECRIKDKKKFDRLHRKIRVLTSFGTIICNKKKNLTADDKNRLSSLFYTIYIIL